MQIYTRKPFYYETDRMGIIHHSNYIRYMEEARLELLKELKIDYLQLEKQNIISPVTGISCKYRKMATLESEIAIKIKIVRYTDIIIYLKYEIYDNNTGKVYALGDSEHCFLEKSTKRILKLPIDILQVDKSIRIL